MDDKTKGPNIMLSIMAVLQPQQPPRAPAKARIVRNGMEFAEDGTAILGKKRSKPLPVMVLEAIFALREASLQQVCEFTDVEPGLVSPCLYTLRTNGSIALSDATRLAKGPKGARQGSRYVYTLTEKGVGQIERSRQNWFESGKRARSNATVVEQNDAASATEGHRGAQERQHDAGGCGEGNEGAAGHGAAQAALSAGGSGLEGNGQ